jgi:hypothetical protein
VAQLARTIAATMSNPTALRIPGILPALTPCASWRYRFPILVDCSHMMIDDDTLKQLLRINDELLQLCKWLNEKHDMETSSRLIPLVDDLTHILIEAGKNKLQ